MILNSKTMQGTPVRTVSGQKMGKLVSLEIDTETGHISAIIVKISRALPAMFGNVVVIAWSQIVSMDTSEIVVSDGFVVEQNVLRRKSLVASAATPEA